MSSFIFIAIHPYILLANKSSGIQYSIKCYESFIDMFGLARGIRPQQFQTFAYNVDSYKYDIICI